ncbi:MAG: hypothetical protein JJ974_01730 [Phycisphaerales bacterium]|nr:hypothetical protein [Phycisphaerales bacterium]
MKFARKPVSIQAEIEPEGARVVGNEGGELIHAGMLIPWDRVDSTSGYYRLIDEDGVPIELVGKRVFLRFGSYWKSPQKSTRLKVQEAKKSVYLNPDKEFEIDTLPYGIQKAAVKDSVFELAFGALILFQGVRLSTRVLSQSITFAQSTGRVFVLAIFMLGLLLIVSGVVRYLKRSKSYWVVSISNRGVTVRFYEQERLVPWKDVEMLPKTMALQPLLIEQRECAYIVQTSEIRDVLHSRLRPPRPKLLTLGFFMTIFLSLMSGPIAAWFYQYLQVPLTMHWAVISGAFLALSGVLLLNHSVVLKEYKKTNENASRRIPMNP